MASFLNKAKEKIEATLNQNSKEGNNPSSGNYGPHGSSTGNRLDPQVDSDRDHRNDPTSRLEGYGNTQATDQYGTTQGAGGFASSDTYGSSTNNPGYDNVRSSNTGPHSSNLLNKVNPRVDSDRDHRNDPTSRTGGLGNTQQYGDSYGQTAGVGGLRTSDTDYGRTGMTGTHGSAPTHDTVTGHRAHVGHTSHTGHTGGLAAATTTGTSGGGIGGGSNYDNPRSINEGPHSSNLLNKLDPRTDSDRDHRNDPTSRVGGYGTQSDTYGHTGGIQATTGTTGTYDSGATTGGYTTGATTGTAGGYGDTSYLPGTGNASKTAGPHDSNIANKLDPRVDSDLDGSKTYGGNQTYR